MGTSLIAVFGILVILGNLLRTGCCKFGDHYDYPCHCQNDAVCDPLDGSCPAGCDDGNIKDPEDYWYTGAWTGYGCQIACAWNTWGANCQERCNCLDDMGTCNRADGSCPSGCRIGYGGTGCNIADSTVPTLPPLATKTMSTTSIIVGVVFACVIGAVVIIVVAILLRRHRDQKIHDTQMMATPGMEGAIGNGNDGMDTEGANHVYESIEEEDVLALSKDQVYENQTPSGRQHPINGPTLHTGDISRKDKVFVETRAHNRPGVLAQSTEEGYESLAPSAREVDDKYEMIEGRAVVLPRTSDHIYENY